MSFDGPSGVPPGLRGADFPQGLTGVRQPAAEKLPGSTNVPGMGTVAVMAQAVPVREGGKPSPVQAARSPATQSGSSIGQKILQALKAVWNYFMAPSPPAAPKAQLGQAQAPQRASAGASAINAGWTQAPAAAQGMALSLVQAEAGSGFREFVDGGTPTGAHEVFWKDLNRANYTVQLANGESQRIDVKDESGSMAPQEMSQRKMASLDQVRQLCGGDEALTNAVTKMAHQGLASALQNPFMPSGPGLGLVMPDGSRGVPMASGGEGTEASYALSAGPGPGEISIRAEYSVRSPDVAFTHRGLLSLDPERSGYTASISIAVSVDAQGALQARVTKPLESEYSVMLAREPAAEQAQAAGPSVRPSGPGNAPQAADGAARNPVATRKATFEEMEQTLASAMLVRVPAQELIANIDIALRDGVISADQAQALKLRITPDASPASPQAVKAEPTLSAPFQPLTALNFMYRDQHVSALGSIYQERARVTAPDVIFTAPVSNLEGASLAEIFRGAAFEQHFGNDFKMAIPIHSGAQEAGHWTGVFVSVDTTGKTVDILGVDSLGGERSMPPGIRDALQELFSDPVFFEGFNLKFGVTEPAYRQGSTLSCGPCTLENLLHLATDAATPDVGQATDMTALRQRQALSLQSAA